jgi:hypothetical protein
VGEQTSSSLAYTWFDHVANDMEAAGYACWAADIPAFAVSAPHRRQRLWWVATPAPIALANATSHASDVPIRPAAGGVIATGSAPAHQPPPGPWNGLEAQLCADGKHRVSKPGICWVVDGLPDGMVSVRTNNAHAPEKARPVNRAALWRGFGGAIVPQLGAQFLAVLMEAV